MWSADRSALEAKTYVELCAPGNAVEEEEPSREDVIQLVQWTEVQVGWGRASAVVNVQHRYGVKMAGGLKGMCVREPGGRVIT